MKWFKRIDCWIQTLVILLLTITTLAKENDIYLAYFVVGGFQVVSMLVHATNKWFIKKGSIRYYYHWVTFISVAAMLLGCAIPIFWAVFIPLLFLAPVMALIYVSLCYNELALLNTRPLAILK